MHMSNHDLSNFNYSIKGDALCLSDAKVSCNKKNPYSCRKHGFFYVLGRRRCITPEKNCAWSFAGTVDSISLAQDEAAGTLTVTVSAADGATWTLTFSEEGFSA